MLRNVYIDGYPFPMYAVMGFSGFLFALVIALVKGKRFGLRLWDTLRIAAFGMVGAVIGARLLGAFVELLLHGGEPGFWTAENWLAMFKNSGRLYGGLLGCIGMTALGAKLCRAEIKSAWNVLAYAALAFASLTRLGCYCAGCCYGIALASGERFPVQLVEAGFCFTALLAFLILRPERRWPDVPLLPINLIIYSVGRFILEFVRGDANRGVWILSTSQWIGLALIALSIVWLRKNAKTRQKVEK
jgi:phosphatidylglycerol:prolipoprotein diacylglycerol transferase